MKDVNESPWARFVALVGKVIGSTIVYRLVMLVCLVMTVMGLWIHQPSSRPMTESEKFIVENFEFYKSGAGTAIGDPIYPDESSEMGLVEIRYRITKPDTGDWLERPIPILRQDNVKKGDAVKVETFCNPKEWRQDLITFARPIPPDSVEK